MVLKDSPAKVFLLSESSRDFYFHVFENPESYVRWESKNRMALIFLDGVPLPEMASFSSPKLSALGVIQSKNGRLRANLKYRSILYASENYFEAEKDFEEPKIFSNVLIKASKNIEHDQV
jgi:hypothetical protein